MARVKRIDSFTGEFKFLSNFYRDTFYMGRYRYSTAEHAYQSEKTGDALQASKIRHARTPGEAKRLGRKVDLRGDWEFIKVARMLEIIRHKFQDTRDAELLMNTGDAILIEGNRWHDNFWGDCQCSKCIDIEGQNYLGRILMQVRAEARDLKITQEREW